MHWSSVEKELNEPNVTMTRYDADKHKKLISYVGLRKYSSAHSQIEIHSGSNEDRKGLD